MSLFANSEIFQNMTRVLLLSEQHMIYPSIFSNYYRLLSINVKIFARMGFSTKMISDYVHIQSFMGTKTIEKFRQLLPHNNISFYSFQY